MQFRDVEQLKLKLLDEGIRSRIPDPLEIQIHVPFPQTGRDAESGVHLAENYRQLVQYLIHHLLAWPDYL